MIRHLHQGNGMMLQANRKDFPGCTVERRGENHFIGLQASVGDEKESEENE